MFSFLSPVCPPNKNLSLAADFLRFFGFLTGVQKQKGATFSRENAANYIGSFL